MCLLPFEEALRVSLEVDGVPFGDDGEEADEGEPGLAEEGHGLEVGEAMGG